MKTIIGLLLMSVLWWSCGVSRTASEHNYLSNTKTVEEIQQLDNKLERLFYLYCGEFTNQAQADTATNPAFGVHQDLITIPIWRERVGEYWIYTAWFKHGDTERALSHGIARFSRESRDTFKMQFYLIPDSDDESYSHEWLKARPFANLRPKDLFQMPNCYNYVVERGNDEFEVLPLEEPCFLYNSEQRQYIKYRAIVNANGISQFSAFFDKNKIKVFEYAPPAGLQLQRLDKNKPMYLKHAKSADTAKKAS